MVMNLPEQALDCFSPTYAIARDKCRSETRRSGGLLTCYEIPEALGPDGLALTIDVAAFGEADAERGFLVLSGTHGGEGFAGSAAQVALMRSGALGRLEAGTRVVLVHGLNPHGFAHGSRTNENNVDLNRNFLAFDGPLPTNEGYAQVHGFLCPDQWTPASRAAADRARADWIEAHGTQAWLEAIMKGQWQEPTGLSYGGRQPQRSHLVLRQVVRDHLPHCRKLAFIDWHTGLGAYGEPFLLCFNEPGGELWNQCCAWWGRERIEDNGAFKGGKRPSYQGLVFHGLQRFMGEASVAGAVIEFGTVPIEDGLEQLRVDRWLRFGAGNDDPATRSALRHAVVEAVCPSDPAWRQGVVAQALEIQLQALQGLSQW